MDGNVYSCECTYTGVCDPDEVNWKAQAYGGGGLLWQTAFQSASKPCLYLQIVFLASHVIKKPFGSILSLDREGNRR